MLNRDHIFYCLAIAMVTGLLMVGSTSYATPVFYLTPGLNPGADLDGDLTFQSAVAGMNFIEDDFDEYESYGYPGPVLSYGNVDVTLSMSNGNVPRTWEGCWDGGAGVAGGLYGAIYGRALPSYGAHGYNFTFSGTDIVKGFGIWVFDDDTGYADDFTMTVVGVDGTSWTSGVLDANPGETNHAIDGFIGVKWLEGIKSVTINNPQSGVFHLDHMQIASVPVPEPSTILLMGIGLLGLMGIKARKKKS